MQFLNSTNQTIIVFVYDPGDLVYLNAMRDARAPHPLANAEMELRPGASGRLRHTANSRWMVGIKASGLGRLGRFLVALSADTYDSSDRLELTPAGLVWLTKPVPVTEGTKQVTETELNTPLPAGPERLVGVGKARITDLAAKDSQSGLPMQGWATASQTSMGIDGSSRSVADSTTPPMELMARAFIIGDSVSQTRAVIVVADIWSASIAMHQEVVRRLGGGGPESRYNGENVMIVGTHTHSAMGGYLHHLLYNMPLGLGDAGPGLDPHVFECVVEGIVCAIGRAHRALTSGRVSVVRGSLSGLTRNRSQPAFDANPATDRARFPNAVDETVLQLNFETESAPFKGDFRPVGLLNWFAIHPTNFGKEWRLLNGDNKGWAAHVVESDRGPDFVAGFANGNAGDVSGNFKDGDPGFSPVNHSDFQLMRDRMCNAGDVQAKLAMGLLGKGGSELKGPVRSALTTVDMVGRTGAPGALGLSMMAGSTEDGGASFPGEGVKLFDPRDPFNTSAGDILGTLAAPLTLALNGLIMGVSVFLSRNLLRSLMSSAVMPHDHRLIAAHFPKPILLAPGLIQPDPWVPDIIPLQLLRCGQFATLGVPAEVTTVAGERLRRSAASALNKDGVEHIQVTTYANGYASYVTTPEEYGEQHYEGASTLYGPDTLPVLEDATRRLAVAQVTRVQAPRDAPLRDLRDRVIKRARITFRNESDQDIRFRLYFPHDRTYALLIWPGADFVVKPQHDRALFIPFLPALVMQMVQVVAGTQRLSPRLKPGLITYAMVHDLVVLTKSGALIRTEYYPENRAI